MKFLTNRLTYLMPILSLVFLLACSLNTQSTNSTLNTSFTKSDFKKIQWLEGAWRGSGEGVEPFFERYHFTNDNTIEVEFFSDAALKNLTKKETITLVDGEIRYGKSSALRLDDKSIDFVAKDYSFSWETESADVWIARLYSPAPEGRKLTRLYRMERIK
jgi:hypothetical protein